MDPRFTWTGGGRGAVPGAIRFAAGSLGLLAVLSLLSLPLLWISCAIDKPPGFNIEVLLLIAHAAIPVLALTSGLGLRSGCSWARRLALATFGLLGALGLLVLFLSLCPVPLLGGLADPDWLPLAGIYLAWLIPAVVLLRSRPVARAPAPAGR